VTILVAPVLIIALALAALHLQNVYKIYESPPRPAQAATPPAVTAQQIRALDERLDDLTARLTRLEQQPTAAALPAAETGAGSSAELVRLRSDVVALTTTLTALQEQMKQTAGSSSQNQQEVLAALVNSLTALASSGRSFKPELAFVQQAAARDSALAAPLTRLNPIAETGAPSLAALTEEFAGLERPLEAALRRSEADTWQGRLWAEAQGLVTIRPLHPKAGQEGTIGAMADDLAQGKLEAALDKVKDLPPPAQALLKDWRSRASARQKLDATLAEITQRLMGPD
jgi:hypothetical protein